MKLSEHEAFRELIADAMSFYRRDVTAFALSVWWQACQPYTFQQVSKAFTAHAMDPERGQFVPMPADIVRALQGTHTDRALVAWGKVLETIQRVGAYQTVVFDDGVIHAVVEDIGGWPAVCRTEIDDLPHVERRFCESYRAYSRRPGVTFPPKLIGVSEQENALRGHAGAPPLLVGDQAAAKRVLADGVATGRLAINPLQALESAMPKRIGRAA